VLRSGPRFFASITSSTAVVSGAKVTGKNVAANVLTTAVTNSTGGYSILTANVKNPFYPLPSTSLSGSTVAIEVSARIRF
jgi:hypothetical protein